MASAPIGGEGGGGDGAREKQRGAVSKVYTRKAFKGSKNNKTSNTKSETPSTSIPVVDSTTASVVPTIITDNNNNDIKNENTSITNSNVNDTDINSNQPPQSVPTGDGNLTQQQPILRPEDVSNDCLLRNHQEGDVEVAAPAEGDLPSGNGTVKLVSGSQLKTDLTSRSKKDVRELRQKLEGELDKVRSLVKRIEVKQGQFSGYSNSHPSIKEGVEYGGGAKRAHSEVASAGVPREVSRPSHQLRISTSENSHGLIENIEKEKRTPKANQFYRNSEFLLAKDKFPPAESHKKSKSNGKKSGGGGELGLGFGMGTKFFKSCSSLLEKLMKHKHGWVFDAPVDVEGLGLHDYYTIIKHPMDLGTVKTRLNKNWYKSPKEFAEDVRLTFRNAMTYNPKGQDVHVMAEQLLKIFEERWAIIESDYNRELRVGLDYGVALTTPTFKKAPLPRPPPLDMRRILDRSESVTHQTFPTPRPMTITPSSRTPAPKKPKAKDPNKRDMTYEEKQKLSVKLQSLPPDKLDAIVQIIKKRNSAVCQHDEEIEVDIDSVDAETLWELDRFVTNYKKSLSKNKRKAERALQVRAEAERHAEGKTQALVVPEAPKESKADEKIVSSTSPIQGERQGDDRSRSSSSSSSSSDSESSSSDSDSESSSASGSDAGLPRS